MRFEDDSDMKIVGVSAEVNTEKDDEEEYERQLVNGNLAKARRLGAALADMSEKLESDGPSAYDAASIHKKLLMLFALVVGVEEKLGDQLLMRATLNVFYDTLKKEKPMLYDAMSSTGAFTFYYLAWRRDGGDVDALAASFAMLCGRKDDSDLAAKGRTIFTEYRALAGKAVDELAFTK